MFIRASMEVYPRLHHISLGATSRYAIVAEDGSLTLTDPGGTAHLAALEDRLTRCGLSLSKLTRVLVTHLDADRVGCLPSLRKRIPALKVFGNSAMLNELRQKELLESLWNEDTALAGTFAAASSALPLNEFRSLFTIDKSLVDGESITIDEDISVRCVATPGHRTHSLSYLVQPHNFLITDETLGYYNGRRLASPGADASLQQSLESVKRFRDIDLAGIGFPYGGCVTGSLVRKHLDAISQNTSDLMAETAKALAEGVSKEEVFAQIKESFFIPSLADPCLVRSMERTLSRIWPQLTN